MSRKMSRGQSYGGRNVSKFMQKMHRYSNQPVKLAGQSRQSNPRTGADPFGRDDYVNHITTSYDRQIGQGRTEASLAESVYASPYRASNQQMKSAEATATQLFAKGITTEADAKHIKITFIIN